MERLRRKERYGRWKDDCQSVVRDCCMEGQEVGLIKRVGLINVSQTGKEGRKLMVDRTERGMEDKKY